MPDIEPTVENVANGDVVTYEYGKPGTPGYELTTVRIVSDEDDRESKIRLGMLRTFVQFHGALIRRIDRPTQLGSSMTRLQDRAYQQSKDKGFYEGTSVNVAEKFALIHSEVSEALEEHRAGRGLTETYYRADGKPEGVPAELADTIIRILDFAGWAGIDLETAIVEKLDYNATRPHKHGKAY